MKRRIAAIFMAASIVLTMCIPISFAVTPADPLIASALYSFVLSAGIKLFRDGGIPGTEELVEEMQTVYEEYKNQTGTNKTWSMMGQGVTFGNGQFIINRDSAQTMQGFTDWLVRYYEGKPGKTVTLIEGDSGGGSSTVPGSFNLTLEELQKIPGYNSNWFVPVYTSTIPVEYTIVDGSGKFVIAFKIDSSSENVHLLDLEYGDTVSLYLISDQPFYFNSSSKDSEDQEVWDFDQTTYVDNATGVSGDWIERPNNNGSFSYYAYPVTTRASSRININSVATANDIANFNQLKYLAYVVLAGDKENESGGLLSSFLAKFGDMVINQVGLLADDQALTIDVGLSDTATEDEAIDVVVNDIAIPDGVSDVVASAVPVPVEGVEEFYPNPATTDIENLGLPELGQALTSRFPFCIPFDVVNAYKSLNATAVCPVIDVDLFPQAFKNKIGITSDTSFTIDFGDQKYALFIQLIHWGSLVGFVLMLAFATKRLIWTTGG